MKAILTGLILFLTTGFVYASDIELEPGAKVTVRAGESMVVSCADQDKPLAVCYVRKNSYREGCNYQAIYNAPQIDREIRSLPCTEEGKQLAINLVKEYASRGKCVYSEGIF